MPSPDESPALIRSLEHTDDPHGAMFRKIRDRMREMENERVHKLSELESLQQENPQTDPESLDLLDELPAGETDLAAAPSEVLRWLFEAFRLEVRYDKPSNWTNCRVTVGNQALDQLAVESAKLVGSTTGEARTGKRSLLVRAPGENRTKRVHFCAYVDVNLRPHLEGLSSSPGATSSAMGGPIGSAIGSAMDTGH